MDFERASKAAEDLLTGIDRWNASPEVRVEAARVYATLAQADAIDSLRVAVKDLGVGNAITPMGAVEYLATELKGGLDNLSNSIDNFNA